MNFPQSSSIKYRPDINGLRALAVSAVVLYHTFPLLIKKGFLGVDVFFVISGYLISKIIISELYDNSFSFVNFYIKRVNRIFPSLFFVLFFCFVFGWIALLPDEYKQLGQHIKSGAIFTSNFLLLNEVGYFDKSADLKPLLHLWSLSIEEQFYVFLPIFFYFVWRIKFNFLWAILFILSASFYLNIKNSSINLMSAFYLPHTRFWELLCGSFLAIIEINRKINFDKILLTFNMLENTFRNLISAVGFLLLIYGFFILDDNYIFPGAWALAPVLGSMLIIAAGSGAYINKVFLSNKFFIWLGIISFPLYLWHWPLVSFARIIEGENLSVKIRIFIIFISVFFAWVTYELVEKPVRFGKKNKGKFFSLITIAIAAWVTGFITYENNGFVSRGNVKKNIENLSQFSMPDLTKNHEICLKIMVINYKGHCLYFAETHDLNKLDYIFIGDSHGEALSIGLFDQENKKSFLSLGLGGCPPLIGVDRFNQDGSLNCKESFMPAYDLFKKYDFLNTTLVLVGRYSAYVEGTGFGAVENMLVKPGHLHIQKNGPRSNNENNTYKNIFYDGLIDTLSAISPRVKDIIIVLQIPELGFDPRLCVSRFLRASKFDCKIPKEDVLIRQENYRLLIKKAAINYSNVKIYDPIDFLCDKENCYPIKNNNIFYRDSDHIGALGAKFIIKDMYNKGYLN